MTAPVRPADGYASDTEFLAEVECAECGKMRDEVTACQQCGDLDCCTVADRACERDGVELVLCDECAPRPCGCPWCDPPDPRDR